MKHSPENITDKQIVEAVAQSHPVHPTNAFIEFKKEEIEQSLPQRFEQQVSQYPDRIAVKSRSQEFTYTALNQAANRVARAILAQRGEGEEPIALLLEHDAPMIAAILGVLKAGKIYVPLDPSYPQARAAYILEDSQPGLIVTNNRHLSLVSDLDRNMRQLINIDEINSTLSTENLNLSILPDTLAYILYTSGSTGQPKGVVQNHRNVLHDARQYTNTLHICPDDRMTLLYSCSVNGSVRGIFGALFNGAALYPLDIKKEGLVNLADLLIQEEITFYHSVPTVFRHFINTLTGKEKFPKLRLIRFGGERVLARDVELYKKHFSEDCLLYTGMGATETGHIRQYFIDKKTQIAGSIVPTGYAVEDIEVLLLNDAGEEIGFNRVGEIALKSRYLSPGYWRKPDLTQAVFLSAPAGGSERIYLTGDLGRMRPDGCLEYLGRKDFQVKVRGYRIEVAEIEMALLEVPGIKEAVVVAREDKLGENRLVAYIVPNQAQASKIGNRRRYRLPNNMAIVHQYKAETDYIYEDIFVDQIYLRHGITVNDGDCIFDVGANIGLFTLFVHQQCKNPTVYAFEPSPPIFELLSINAALYGSDVKLFQCGLSNEAKTATFTFYPKCSGLSSFYADKKEEKEVLQLILDNQLRGGMSEIAPLMQYSEQLIEERLKSKTFTCQLRTLSDLISENNVERIDLLKIDVQKSEADVLAGIEEDDWKKIKQIVIELHDVPGRLEQVVALLNRRGYKIAVQRDILKQSSNYFIYAVQHRENHKLSSETQREVPDRPLAYVVPNQEDPSVTVSELRSFLKEKLPEYMIPAVFVFLEVLPLTANGKVDRNKLPIPDWSKSELETAFVPPRDILEFQLMKIWEQVLGIRPIGVTDNFFELGGHSLLAVQLSSQIEKAFNKKLPLVSLFQLQTIEQLASVIRQEGWVMPWFSLVKIQPEIKLPSTFEMQTVEQQTIIPSQEESSINTCQSNPQLSPQEIRELLASTARWTGKRFGPNFLLMEINPCSTSSKRPFFWVNEGDHLMHLGSEQPVYCLPYGWIAARNPTTYIKALASLYVNEIRAIQPSGPYFLGGYCFTGLVALEMAHQLQAQGQSVALLALLETLGPNPILYHYRQTVGLAIYHWRKLLQLSPAEQLAYVLERIRRVTYRVLSKLTRLIKVDEDGRSIASPPSTEHDAQFLMAFRQAAQSYRQSLSLAYPERVVLFCSNAFGYSPSLFPQGGWGKLWTSKLDLQVIPGEPMSMLSGSNAQVVAEKLRAYLNAVQ